MTATRKLINKNKLEDKMNGFKNPQTLIPTLVLMMFISVVVADVPQMINYQGKLTNPSGDPVADGDYDITFKIWNWESGGTLLWNSGPQAITVTGGLFSYKLGSVVPLPQSMFTDTTRWLEITVQTDPPISPRTRFITVPYAYHSLRSDTADYAMSSGGSGGGWVDDGASVRLETTSDYVGIGTSSPANRLHIVGTESSPLLNVEKTGSGRGVRVSTTSACAIWVENSGNHGLRVTNANGDGIHVTYAGGWAGYFNGDAYISGDVGIGTSSPDTKLDVNGTTKTTTFNMPTGATDGYLMTSDAVGNGTWQAPASGSCCGESGEFDGEVNADMVEDLGANTIINFDSPFTSTEKPHMHINVVLKGAANGLVEGAAIKAVVDIKGSSGNWTGFDITVLKYSDGTSIDDTTPVYVTWMAIER
jgi:hypothetical protein